MFIVNGTDLKFTKKKIKVDDAVLEYIYIKKKTEIKIQILIIFF